jgi:hypothetical protein
MSGIDSITVNPPRAEVALKSKADYQIKPEVDRVRANPFYPEGRMPRLSDSPQQRFEANLPGQTLLDNRKIGTVLNTLA